MSVVFSFYVIYIQSIFIYSLSYLPNLSPIDVSPNRVNACIAYDNVSVDGSGGGWYNYNSDCHYTLTISLTAIACDSVCLILSIYGSVVMNTSSTTVSICL